MAKAVTSTRDEDGHCEHRGSTPRCQGAGPSAASRGTPLWGFGGGSGYVHRIARRSHTSARLSAVAESTRWPLHLCSQTRAGTSGLTQLMWGRLSLPLLPSTGCMAPPDTHVHLTPPGPGGQCPSTLFSLGWHWGGGGGGPQAEEQEVPGAPRAGPPSPCVSPTYPPPQASGRQAARARSSSAFRVSAQTARLQFARGKLAATWRAGPAVA